MQEDKCILIKRTHFLRGNPHGTQGEPTNGLILTIVHYFLAGPIFLHINTLARPAGSTQSRSENQSMRASAVGSGGELKFFLTNSGLR